MRTSFLKLRKRSFETVLTSVIYHLCSPYHCLIIHFLLVLTISFGIYKFGCAFHMTSAHLDVTTLPGVPDLLNHILPCTDI